jgi:phosphatidate cytidylyltransferase
MAVNRQQLAKRLMTAAVGVPAAIVFSLVGGPGFLIVVNFVIGVGLFEFYRMMECKGIRPYKTVGIIAGLGVSWYVYFQEGVFSSLFVTVVLALVMVMELFRREGGLAVFHISTTILGVFYVAWFGSHIILLRQLGESSPWGDRGGWFVILAFALAWMNDTGAYFFGSAFGRTKLLPRVSPNKSVEGAIGGLALALATAFVAQHTFASFLTWWDALALGTISAVAATLGDLVESLIKRDAKIKDTSHALPGHGGMLDRFDSVLFVAPFVYYYLRFIVPKFQFMVHR